MSSIKRRASAFVAMIVLAGAGCGGGQAAISTASPTPTRATPTPAEATATPTPATATPAGQMTHGRSYHPATLLDDGRVLLAGGYFDRYPIKVADLYDPTSGTFSATGPMAKARGFDTATRLADGRVLFAGGDPSSWDFDGPFMTSAELYDPATGTFSPTGELTEGRNVHTGTLLVDGRVLIAGGDDHEASSIDSAELYDPATGTFSSTGSMTTARAFHTSTLLPDGRVLLTGGTSDGWDGAHFLASAEIYDPKTGKFTATGSMQVARGSHTATLLLDGRVLVIGGTAKGDPSFDSAELFDLKTGKFTATGSMTTGRTFHDATLLADGRVLVTGGDPQGWKYDGPFLASAEIFDPETGSFTPTGSMIEMLTNHTATLLPDGRVLIAGGYDGGADVNSAEIYDPTTGTFSPAGSGG